MKNKDKLYIVTRRDLKPGAQIAQSLHAFREFIEHHHLIEDEWYRNSNHIVILAAQDEVALYHLIDRLNLKNIKYSTFKEPDFNHSLTAIAISPGINSVDICKNLPLALNGL